MAIKHKKTRQAKTLDALNRLEMAADRCQWKFGHDDAGKPIEWDEWTELRRAIMEARHALAREGREHG